VVGLLASRGSAHHQGGVACRPGVSQGSDLATRPRSRPYVFGLQAAVHSAAVANIEDDDAGLVVLHAVDDPPRTDSDP